MGDAPPKNPNAKPKSAAAAILAHNSDDKNQRFDSADWAQALQKKNKHEFMSHKPLGKCTFISRIHNK